MTAFVVEPAFPVRLTGTAFERGLAQAAAGVAHETVFAATIGRVEQARAEGVLDAAALEFLHRQRAFLLESDPHTMAELAGIAEGFDLPEDELFIHQHLSLLRDLSKGAGLDADGCSTFAIGEGPEGPLVVKNRDFSGIHVGIQRVFLHEGPDIETGRMLCVGSAGSPGAYSSGINAAGLALVDTHIGSRRHGIGWLRYFAMTRILATCRSVPEAIAFLRARRHAGGGSVTLADRYGHVASVEFGTDLLGVEEGRRVWRTNHFVSPELSPFNFTDDGDRIDANSFDRFAYLSREVPVGDWTVPRAARLMATHAADGPHCGPLCQHGEKDAARTISSAIFACNMLQLYFLEGNPCEGRWRVYDLTG
ncbi:C45 family autoproteolytic acyltransferase/hydolase [Neorhizobium petrolearium]|uniref:C45 family autoproteolytic acyltransferase/hydrolase n=1 Tax=Neorhizobium petrolearium TaxID=515361 RepID=A0ABY8M3S2_9HYPH|nr:C45 family peptidase [Neorhizobium petrolearium]MCC2608871.1 C45 family peptidase [Neorhizobium petrolearium]WGI69119.1 C45 family autoproteolytic acyltransferase/hydrolase [Neorhizobium petrolearium]